MCVKSLEIASQHHNFWRGTVLVFFCYEKFMTTNIIYSFFFLKEVYFDYGSRW